MWQCHSQILMSAALLVPGIAAQRLGAGDDPISAGPVDVMPVHPSGLSHKTPPNAPLVLGPAHPASDTEGTCQARVSAHSNEVGESN